MVANCALSVNGSPLGPESRKPLTNPRNQFLESAAKILESSTASSSPPPLPTPAGGSGRATMGFPRGVDDLEAAVESRRG